MYTYIEIVKYDGEEVIKRYDVTDKGEREIGKFESGLSRNMNHTEYYIRDKQSETKLELK